MMIDRNGKFRLVKLTEGKQAWKLCRIEGKTTVPGGKTQLNLHDGRNVLVGKDSYKAGDVVKLEVPSQKILETYKLAKGNYRHHHQRLQRGRAGGHRGVHRPEDASAPNLVKFKDGKLTVKDNVFVVGSKGPEVELPEASVL